MSEYSIKTSSESPEWSSQIWRVVLGVLVSALVLFLIYQESLKLLGHTWLFNENYGHGLFVPPIALYLAWEKRKHLRECDGQGAWMGLLIIAAGMALFIMGQLATLFVVQHEYINVF